MEDKGTIIFLNGVSSAGKTTLALEILENPHKRYWWLSHDNSGYPFFMVLVTCHLEELRRREQEQGDRKIGRAEWQITLHDKDISSCLGCYYCQGESIKALFSS